MKRLLDGELNFLELLASRPYLPNVAALSNQPVRTRSSLLSLKQLLEVYHFAVVEALLDEPPQCPGQSTHVQVFDGPLQAAVATAASSVCQILYSDGMTPLAAKGTAAFVLNDNLLLSAAHILPLDWVMKGVGQVVARFGFEEQPNGTLGGVTDFPVVAHFDFLRGGIDFVLLETGRDDAGRLPVDLATRLALGVAQDVQSSDALVCIHHPLGEPKQVSVGALLARSSWAFIYDNHTEHRSSGAPVLDSLGRLVAVHAKEDYACLRKGSHIDAIRAASTML